MSTQDILELTGDSYRFTVKNEYSPNDNWVIVFELSFLGYRTVKYGLNLNSHSSMLRPFLIWDPKTKTFHSFSGLETTLEMALPIYKYRNHKNYSKLG